MSIRTVVEDLRSVLLLGAGHRARTERQLAAGAVGDLVRAAHDRPPRPDAALAALLERGVAFRGLCADKGDLPATAASNAPARAPRASGEPKRRQRMIVEWLAGLGLAAKLSLAASVAAASVAAAGTAAVLPTPAQDTFTSAVTGIAQAADQDEDQGEHQDEDQDGVADDQDGDGDGRTAQERAAQKSAQAELKGHPGAGKGRGQGH